MVQTNRVGINNGSVELDQLFQQVRRGGITSGRIIEQALPIANNGENDPHTQLFANGLAWAAAWRLLADSANAPIKTPN